MTKSCSKLFFSAFFLVAFAHPLSAKINVEVSAEAAIMIDADSGAILYEKNSRKLHFPASTTKVATALYALHKGVDLNNQVTAEQESIASISPERKVSGNYKFPSYWVEMRSSHIGIKTGEILSYRDLFYGLMLPSGNDAANVIAQSVSGTIPAFMDELNLYVQSLGCTQTHFTNPHGLHHPEHRTTAYDMALIAKEALKNATFCQVVSTVQYEKPKTNKQEATTFLQKNKLLRKGEYYYPEAIGVKIGYTTIALNNIVSAASHEGRRVIVILLHDGEKGGIFRDSIKLFDAAFKEKKVQRILLETGPQKYTLKIEGAQAPVKTYLTDQIAVEYYPSEEPVMKARILWDKLQLPVEKDQHVGELQLVDGEGKLLQQVPVYAQEMVEKQRTLPTWIYFVAILSAAVLLFFGLSRYQK
jgi:D-alanyl-D-alanine carboxypeptidase (penicillin-binding protein 5/6)